MQEKETDILKNIWVIISAGIALCFVVYIILTLTSTSDDLHTEIGHTSQIISSFSIGLSFVTIYLLYKNYRLQQEEMKKLNDANNDLVKSNQDMVNANYDILKENRNSNIELAKSNQLILFNNQLEYLTKLLEGSAFLKSYLKDNSNPNYFFEDEIRRSHFIKDITLINNILTYCNEHLKLVEDQRNIFFARIPFDFDKIREFVYKEIHDFNTDQQNVLDMTFKNIIKRTK